MLVTEGYISLLITRSHGLSFRLVRSPHSPQRTRPGAGATRRGENLLCFFKKDYRRASLAGMRCALIYDVMYKCSFGYAIYF